MATTELQIKAAKKLEEAAAALRDYDLEVKYKEYIEPVEKKIQEHPIPSVLVGIGAGMLIGATIYKLLRDNYY